MASNVRYFGKYSIATATTKTAISATTPASGDVIFPKTNGQKTVYRQIMIRTDQTISFLFDSNTGTEFPLAANTTVTETADLGKEISEIYISNTSGSTANVYIYGVV